MTPSLWQKKKKKESTNAETYSTKNASGYVFAECVAFDHALTNRNTGAGIGADYSDSTYTSKGINILHNMLERLLHGCAAAARVP